MKKKEHAMKTLSHIITCSALAAGLCATSLSALAADRSSSRRSSSERWQNRESTSSSRSTSSFGQIQRGSQVLKDDVYDANNKKIGKVDDVVVDLTSGHVLYVVVSASNEKVAVAPGAFASSRGGQLRLSTEGAQKLRDAPQFSSDIDQPQTLSKADFVDKVYQHFGESAWWQGPSAPANAGSFNNVHKVSKLIGTNIQNVNNQPMGEVNNVALDLQAGRVVYVIVTPDKDLKLGKSLYAFPPDAFTLAGDQKTLSSNIDREKLAGAPHFTSDQWSRLSDRNFASEVYQYYGKQAYFNTPGALQPTGREEGSSSSFDRDNNSSSSSSGGWDRSGTINPRRNNSDHH